MNATTSRRIKPAVYLVGGAVRDALLGLPVHDRDYVVTGCTPQQLLDEGFVPVGKDFPVFLHPSTKEEVALARTERKTGAGYHGFAFHAEPGVRIEDDLSRRDITINAIAIDVANTKTEDKKHAKFSAKACVEAARSTDWAAAVHVLPLIDPHGGLADLQAKRLRHVTDAFAEDPVRILRLARFTARFPNFSVAEATNALMQRMVQAGEVDALVAERVWQEFARGLMAAEPVRMLRVLQSCGALARVAPELAAEAAACSEAVARVAKLALPLQTRFAVMCRPMEVGAVASLCKRWRVPQHLRELAGLASSEHLAIWASEKASAPELLALLQRCDAFRRPERFEDLLAACACAYTSGLEVAPRFDRLREAWAAARVVDAKTIAIQVTNAWTELENHQKNIGEAIQEALTKARIAAIVQALAPSP